MLWSALTWKPAIWENVEFCSMQSWWEPTPCYLLHRVKLSFIIAKLLPNGRSISMLWALVLWFVKAFTLLSSLQICTWILEEVFGSRVSSSCYWQHRAWQWAQSWCAMWASMPTQSWLPDTICFWGAFPYFSLVLSKRRTSWARDCLCLQVPPLLHRCSCGLKTHL